MSKRCSVPLCKGTGGSYSFPRSEEMRKKWFAALPMKNFKLSKYSRLCWRHFLPSDIERETSIRDHISGEVLTAPLIKGRLTRTAIPRFFEGFPEYIACEDVKPTELIADSVENNNNAYASDESEDEFICSVPDCWKRSNLEISTYPFPRNKQMLKKWLDVFPVANFKPDSRSSVCERHFVESDFLSSNEDELSETLKATAVPSIFKTNDENTATVEVKLEDLFHDYCKKEIEEEEEVPPIDDDDNVFNNDYDNSESDKEDDNVNVDLTIVKDPLSEDSNEVPLTKYLDSHRDLGKLVNSIKWRGLPPNWLHVVNDKEVKIFMMTDEDNVQVRYSIRVNSKLNVQLFVKNVQVQDLDSHDIPRKIASYEILIPILEKFPTIEESLEAKKTDDKDVLQQILDLTQSLKNERNAEHIAFLIDQLKLSVCESKDYVFSTMVVEFAKLLSKNSYEGVRESKCLVLPPPHLCRSLP